jgi:predicted nucleic acid-binding protein
VQFAGLVTAGLDVQPVMPELALEAGRLRARHYHRENRAVSLADCVIAGAALQAGQPLATADPALAALVREEGGAIVPLPDSGGHLLE